MSQNRQDRLLESLLSLPGNTTCADCKAPAPRWASVNLGIFLCVQCASIHRSLGTHTSRVKSVTMDTWSREMVDRMREVGNIKANAIWNPDESRNPAPISTAEFGERQGEMERFIRDKYEAGLFRADRKTTAAPGVREGSRASSSTSAPLSPPRKPLAPQRADSWTALGIPEARDARRWETPEERAVTYGYNGHGSTAGPSTGKKRATRAHVDSNWADFMAVEERPSSGGDGRKVGRLLGMEGDYEGGEVRLPPVTRAPKGLVYKRENGDTPRRVEPDSSREVQTRPQPASQPQPESQSQTTVAAVAPLIDLAATAPMQRTFPQPPPIPSPLPLPQTNPFLQPHPISAFHRQHTNPSIHTGGYLSAASSPLHAPPFNNPFMQTMPQQTQGFYTPGPTMMMGGGGYFPTQGMGYGQQQTAFGQGMPQGYGYPGWSG